jgi:flagellar hook-associated protein 1 FlgK
MGMSALTIALSGLRVAQTSIENTSHNIANAGTEGFTRQRVDRSSGTPRRTLYGPMGTGVEVVGISRSRDSYLDARVRTSESAARALDARVEFGQRTEDAFAEPDNGVNASLGRLWTSFTTLAQRPGDVSLGTQVLSNLNDLAGRVNQIRTELDNLGTNAFQRLQTDIDKANAAMDRVAHINTISPTLLGPDLEDERDRAIDTLAATVGAAVVYLPDGKARITISGRTVVDGDYVSHLSVDQLSPGVVRHGATGPIELGGSAGGLQSVLTSDLPGYRNKLDAFVTQFVAAMNAQHQANKTVGGANGTALLADDGNAMTVLITDPALLAPADAAGGEQNGRGAAALAAMRTAQDARARDIVSFIGGAVANLTRANDNAQSLSLAAAQQRSAVTGVNLDEEMAQLISDQKAYAAAARIVTTVDQMLDVLVNM